MNSIIMVAVVLAVFCASVDATVRGGVFRHPEHPGKCHFGEGRVLEVGEVSMKHNGNCEMATCYENEHATIMKCVTQKMREGCEEGRVLKPEAPFPHCCNRAIKCKDHYYSQ